MPKMAYFRRPQLAGKALRRPSAPTLRGSLRRRNPDGTIAEPYFSGLPGGGGTLIVQSKFDPNQAPGSTTVSVVASGGGTVTMSSLLTQLNAQLSSIKVSAFDDGGCVGFISTSTTPADAWIAVTGGTASAALGFDTTVQPFRAVPGDLKSAPEGRTGNPFGAVLPTPGENFDSDAVTRALGRIMSNMDVLYSEQSREEPVVTKIGSVVGPASYVDVESVVAGQRVFTAGTPNTTKVLSATSTKEEIARFFYLMDQVSKQQAQSAVSGVTDGANTNVLGVEQQVATGSITDIPSGDILRIGVSVANAKPGDYVKIAGANNGSWRNNGYRWVVEEVPDSSSLRVRPMSSLELELVGETIDEVQPVVELSTVKSSGETYGTATVYRSPFAPSVRLQLSPPVPTGATYDLYAAIPASKRTRAPSAVQDSMRNVMGHAVRARGEMGNTLLTAPTFSSGTGGVATTEFYVRWNGRVIRVPAATVPVTVTGNGMLYVDSADGAIKAALDASVPADALIVATFTSTGSYPTNSVTPTNARRLEALDKIPLTVGTNCQFSTIQEAIVYVGAARRQSAGQRFEIILVEDLILAPGATAIAVLPDVHIRGANESVTLKSDSGSHPSSFFTGPASGSFTVSDLTVELWAGQTLISGSSDTSTGLYWSQVNVVTKTTAGPGAWTWDRYLVKDAKWTIRVRMDGATKEIYFTPSSGNGAIHAEADAVYILSLTATGALSGASLGVTGAATAASVAATGLVSGNDVTADDTVTGLHGIFNSEVRTPEVTSYGAPGPQIPLTITILSVAGEDFYVSLEEAALLSPGVYVDQGGTEHGYVSSVDPLTGLVLMDVYSEWDFWTVGSASTNATVASGAATLNLLGDGGVPGYSVRIGNKTTPRTDSLPILRVANDAAGNVPVLDVTKDGFDFYDTLVKYTSVELLERVWKRMARIGSVGALGTQYYYKGNNDVSILGGGPNINKLTLRATVWDAATHVGILEGTLQPISLSDNLDQMMYAKFEWYTMKAGWNGVAQYDTINDLVALGTTYVPLSSRLFTNVSINNPVNAAKFSAHIQNPALVAGAFCRPACRVTLYNILGPSESHWFATSDSSTPNLVDIGIGGLPQLYPEVYLSPTTQTIYMGDGEVAGFTLTGGTAPFVFSEDSGASNGAWTDTTPAAVVWTPSALGTTVVRVTDAQSKFDTATVNILDTSPPDGDPGAGGDGGPLCSVTENADILLPGGATAKAATIQAGTDIWTMSDSGGEAWGKFQVSEVVRTRDPIITIKLVDGRALDVTPDHRFYVQKSWVQAALLKPGMALAGSQPGVVAEVGTEKKLANIVKMRVRFAKTYVADGILGHNLKPQ